MLRFLVAAAVSLLLAVAANAQAKPSECLAIAQGAARVQFASLKKDEVQITYADHSTFVIETQQGVRAATDYAGYAGGGVPDIVTMNHAHSSHYTNFPDPGIKHVLKGWPEAGQDRASHDIEVSDLRVRNVTTDIRDGAGGREVNGNSIFVFETAGLCIGHLGHLHQELSPEQVGRIGRLDVVMVPVDGGMTLPVGNMMAVLKLLRARVILPMHARFAGSLERFTEVAARDFKIEKLTEDKLVVSAGMLPAEPTVYLMPGM